MEEINTAIQILEAGGAVAPWILLVILFYRGDLVTKKTLDRIVAVYEKSAGKMVEFYEKQYGVLLDQNKKLFDHIEKYLDK